MTPSGLPTWARIGIGVLAEAVVLAYVFVVGRAAVPTRAHRRPRRGAPRGPGRQPRPGGARQQMPLTVVGHAGRRPGVRGRRTGVSRPGEPRATGDPWAFRSGSGRPGPAAAARRRRRPRARPGRAAAPRCRRRRGSACSAAAASYTSARSSRRAAIRSRAGSRTDARTTRWWRVSVGSAGRSPSSTADGSRGVRSTTSARRRPSPLTARASADQSPPRCRLESRPSPPGRRWRRPAAADRSRLRTRRSPARKSTRSPARAASAASSSAASIAESSRGSRRPGRPTRGTCRARAPPGGRVRAARSAPRRAVDGPWPASRSSARRRRGRSPERVELVPWPAPGPPTAVQVLSLASRLGRCLRQSNGGRARTGPGTSAGDLTRPESERSWQRGRSPRPPAGRRVDAAGAVSAAGALARRQPEPVPVVVAPAVGCHASAPGRASGGRSWPRPASSDLCCPSRTVPSGRRARRRAAPAAGRAPSRRGSARRPRAATADHPPVGRSTTGSSPSSSRRGTPARRPSALAISCGWSAGHRDRSERAGQHLADVTPSSSASGRSPSRCTRVAWARALTSSGVTKSRPLNHAHARAARSRAVAPRGLTPRLSDGDSRVARAMSTK